MQSFSRLLLSFALTLLAAGAATSRQTDGPAATSSAPSITASAAGGRVRFTAPPETTGLRLEVYGEGGALAADVRGAGSVLDWALTGAGGAALPDGSYRLVLTATTVSGSGVRRAGALSVSGGAASLRAETATAARPLSDGETAGGEDLPLAVLDGGATPAVTSVAHDGADGLLVRGRGALSFRLGDFFGGAEREQMRLTEDGRLGIGTDRPEATLDVAGTIRAARGLVFADGTVLTSATGRAQKLAADGTAEQVAGGTGTPGKLAKWLDNAGTLTDSTFFEDASANVFNFTGTRTVAPGQQPFFEAQRSSSSDIMQRFWNTGTGGAKLRYVAGTGATSQIQLTDNMEWLAAIAGNNLVGLQFRVRGTGSPNSEAGLDASAVLTLARSGRVGIGTASPAATLHIVGSPKPPTVSSGNGISAPTVLQVVGGAGGDTTQLGASGGNGGGVLLQGGDAGNGPFSGTGGNVTLQPGAGQFTGRVLLAPNGGDVEIGVPNGESQRLLKIHGSVSLGENISGITSPFGLHINREGQYGINVRTKTSGGILAGFGELGDFVILSNASSSRRFIVKEGGNVGIGLVAPTEKLDVAGNIKASGNITAAGGLSTAGTLSAGGLEATGDVNTTTHYELGGRRVLAVAGGDAINPPTSTFVGVSAGRDNATGFENTFVGTSAGVTNTTGSGNTALGRNAGMSNFNDMNHNTYIGAHANTSVTGLTNGTAVGYRAFVQRSNSVILGSVNGQNGATETASVGIGTTMPNARLDVRGGVSVGLTSVPDLPNANDTNSVFIANDGGSPLNSFRLDGFDDNLHIVARSPGSSPEGAGIVFSTAAAGGGETPRVSILPSGAVKLSFLGAAGSAQLCMNAASEIAACSSSARYKERVEPFTRGLELLGRLRPVSFDWKAGGGRDLGFVAEEVAGAEPLLATRDASGRVEGVKYDRISAVLVNAVREQQGEIGRQRRTIEELRVENARLRSRGDEQAARLDAQEERLRTLEEALKSAPALRGKPAARARRRTR